MKLRSVSGKSWSKIDYDESIIELIRQKHNVSDFLARLLCAQDVNYDEVSSFLFPTLKALLPDPFHLLDIDKAVNRTIDAIYRQEKICIFGDYDVDGATSIALLKQYFYELGVEVDTYVPERLNEGYGLSITAIRKLKSSKEVNLIITVDCGTSSHAEISEAKALNIDVIVLDHHIGSDPLPAAVAIVNPNRFDETSKYNYLAAVGVSFMFAVALRSALRQRNYFDKKVEPNLMKYLDLVALGTVCDVMVLSGLNRAFVIRGLEVMEQKKNIGLKALCYISKIEYSISCYHLGFVLGPRINAGGRIGTAELGSVLLSTQCPVKAHSIALQLDQLNSERQLIESLILDEATTMAAKQVNNKIIIVSNDNWHPGVIGIIASRIKDLFCKPTIVISYHQNLGRASCRSVKGVDIGMLITKARINGLLIAGGGHSMAGGFTIEPNMINQLQLFLEEEMSALVEQLIECNNKNYALNIDFDCINMQTINEINKMAPFGNGNPEPLFKLSNVKIKYATPLSNNKHVRCVLQHYSRYNIDRSVKGIAFYPDNNLFSALFGTYDQGVSLIGNIKANNFANREEVQFVIKDLIL